MMFVWGVKKGAFNTSALATSDNYRHLWSCNVMRSGWCAVQNKGITLRCSTTRSQMSGLRMMIMVMKYLAFLCYTSDGNWKWPCLCQEVNVTFQIFIQLQSMWTFKRKRNNNINDFLRYTLDHPTRGYSRLSSFLINCAWNLGSKGLDENASKTLIPQTERKESITSVTIKMTSAGTKNGIHKWKTGICWQAIWYAIHKIWPGPSCSKVG